MYLGGPFYPLIETVISEDYLTKIKDLRKRLKNLDIEDLEWYKSILKPKNFLDYLCFFSNSDRVMRFNETSEILEKKVLSDKNKSD